MQKKDQKTVEEEYKKVDPREHVLLRPDMYIGSLEHEKTVKIEKINN
jgi:DNA gyrase/topoisomerase IV subunit B